MSALYDGLEAARPNMSFDLSVAPVPTVTTRHLISGLSHFTGGASYSSWVISVHEKSENLLVHLFPEAEIPVGVVTFHVA